MMIKNIIITILSLFIIFLIIKSHWSTADLSPFATIVGAIVTGLITWFAVRETSKLDRKNRKIENAFKYFEDKIIKLSSCITDIKKLNAKYFDDREGKANEVNDKIISEELGKIDNIKSILESILIHNPQETLIIKTFIAQLDRFSKILKYIQIQFKNISNKPCNFIKKDSNVSNKFYIFFDNLKEDIKNNTNYIFERFNEKDIDNFIKKYLNIS